MNSLVCGEVAGDAAEQAGVLVMDMIKKEVREKHYPGYHYTIFKTPDPEAPGGWKQIEPDKNGAHFQTRSIKKPSL